MADGSHTAVTVNTPSGELISGLKEFAGSHGGAKAVIEYVGRRGARIVLVGNDGEWSDQFVESTAVAREACEKAGVSIENEWGAGAHGAHAADQRPVAFDVKEDAFALTDKLSPSSTRAGARVALVTCSKSLCLRPDDRWSSRPWPRTASSPSPSSGDDPAVDWSAYDAVVLRSPWTTRRVRGPVRRLGSRSQAAANPAAVVEWNDRQALPWRAARHPRRANEFRLAIDAWGAARGRDTSSSPAIGAGSVDNGPVRSRRRRRGDRSTSTVEARRRVVMVSRTCPPSTLR
jgi:hypothetical protein